jgi:DNA/RNA-binding domain of Phe-tRNA-synthetase-like protein
MRFSHHPALWSAFPALVPGVLHASGIRTDVDVSQHVTRFSERARERLDAAGSESDLPEVQAWRRAFSSMGLKPTQYRCASESLLRRFRKEGQLPAIHPLIDLCNAASIAFAIPVAALDVAQIAWPLQVRHATGEESYEAFSGEIERPEPGEVTFADAQGRAHARRWTHRQSGLSAIRDTTREVLIVCEGLHPSAAHDVRSLAADLGQAIEAIWGTPVRTAVLTAAEPAFDFGG